MTGSLFFAVVLSAVSPEAASSSDAAASWIAAHCVRDGAFTVRPDGDAVSGYFGSITAMGLVAARQHPELVNAWMLWYIAHARGSGSGVDGVPDDGHFEVDTFVSRGRPDSTDAYGALFISLANEAYASGEPLLRATVLGHKDDLGRIAASMLATQQSDGLTISRPQHPFAYAIDNEQVYRGLMDASSLWGAAFADKRAAWAFRDKAAAVRTALERVLWDPSSQTYRPVVDVAGRGKAADLSEPYPDALAQLFAVVYGVVDTPSARASALVERASPALLEPPHGDAFEYRAVTTLARRLTGSPLALPAFDPPPLCSDAGWYLLVWYTSHDHGR